VIGRYSPRPGSNRYRRVPISVADSRAVSGRSNQVQRVAVDSNPGRCRLEKKCFGSTYFGSPKPITGSMPPEPCPNRHPAEDPDNEPYACFVQRRDQIAAWLRSGYSVKGVWIACRRSTPPFEASYQTFWRYCRKHGLSVPRGAPPATAASSLSAADDPRKQSAAPGPSPKVWPRVTDQPRTFIPKMGD